MYCIINKLETLITYFVSYSKKVECDNMWHYVIKLLSLHRDFVEYNMRLP